MIFGAYLSGRYEFQAVRPGPAGVDATEVVIVSDRGDEMRWVFTDADAFVDNAREVNGNVSVPMYSVVHMTFAGYDKYDDSVFLFFWPKAELDGNMPPHDHGDNLQGGFAFSTFHPGYKRAAAFLPDVKDS